MVLDQIGRMVNDSHRFQSLPMQYMMCHYRPDLKRERQLFSLVEGPRLKAAVAITLSDFGLNLLDLSNCIKIFALASDMFRRDRFQSLLAKVRGELSGTPRRIAQITSWSNRILTNKID